MGIMLAILFGPYIVVFIFGLIWFFGQLILLLLLGIITIPYFTLSNIWTWLIEYPTKYAKRKEDKAKEKENKAKEKEKQKKLDFELLKIENERKAENQKLWFK